jgi:gluconolactonase
MSMDTGGNLYVATNTGVQIYSASGRYIDTLEIQGSLTNCTFGGDDMRTLFITERQGLYRVTLNVPGIQFPR